MKKIISFALAFCMLMTACVAGFGTVTAFAAETIEGSEVTWSFDDQSKTLSFDGTGDIPDYDTYEDEEENSLIPWADCDYNTVEFGEGITGIGNYALRKSAELVAVTIPKTITKIGKGAFSNCLALKSVSIEAGGATVIGESAFSGCTGLAMVELPEGLTDIGAYAFYKCSSLKLIQLPDSVKTLGTGAFNSCTSLEAFTAPKLLVSIGDRAFYCCEKLGTVSLPESMDYIGSEAFDSCARLTEIVIPAGIQKISDAAFSGCSKLSKVLIPEGIQTIEDNAFALCTSLKNVRIPYSVKEIGQKAFGYGNRGSLVEGFTITGYDTTAAKTYAEENEMSFDSLGDPLAKSGTISETISWEIDEENNLFIIGSGEMADYSLYDMPVYLNSELASISIDEAITKIGAYSMFVDCESYYISDGIAAVGEKAVGYHFDENGKIVKNADFYILGYNDTAAAEYAKENDFMFIPIVSEGICGEKSTWKYDAETKTLTVSGEGEADMYFDDNAMPCFFIEDCPIDRIVIEKGITEIAENAFVDISNGENKITFSIPKSVITIGEHAIGYSLSYGLDENEELELIFAADPNCVIEGYADTAAQKYATENSIAFTELEPEEEPPVEKDTTFKLSDEATICTLDGEEKIIRIFDQNATADKILEDFVVGKDLEVIKPEEIATGKQLETRCETAVDEKYTLVLMGDVNSDGKVNSADALCVLRHVVSLSTLTGAEYAAADIDASKSINSADALVILRISVGLDELISFYPKAETPVDPDNPDPDQPVDPDKPDPDQPVDPDKPDPDQPVDPDKPDPDQPVDPDKPDPDQPVDPDTPDPDQPTDSDKSTESEQPADSQA